MNRKWSDEEGCSIVRRWKAGESAGQIGKEYGVKGSSIIGLKNRYCLRHGMSPFLELPSVPASPKAPTAPPVKRARHSNAGLAFGGFKRSGDTTAPLPAGEPVVLADAGPPRTLLERGAFQCCFPVGGAGENTLYCCEPTDRAPNWQYCGRHLQLMGRAPVKWERDAARPRRAA